MTFLRASVVSGVFARSRSPILTSTWTQRRQSEVDHQVSPIPFGRHSSRLARAHQPFFSASDVAAKKARWKPPCCDDASKCASQSDQSSSRDNRRGRKLSQSSREGSPPMSSSSSIPCAKTCVETLTGGDHHSLERTRPLICCTPPDSSCGTRHDSVERHEGIIRYFSIRMNNSEAATPASWRGATAPPEASLQGTAVRG